MVIVRMVQWQCCFYDDHQERTGWPHNVHQSDPSGHPFKCKSNVYFNVVIFVFLYLYLYFWLTGRTMFIGVVLQSSCPGWQEWSLLYVISVSISDQLLTICWLSIFLTPPPKASLCSGCLTAVLGCTACSNISLPGKVYAVLFFIRFENSPTLLFPHHSQP